MRNSTQVEMCIGGVGRVQIGDSDFSVEKFDVWNVPSMEPQVYRNDGQGLFVRLSYSNAPLLEKLEVHYVDEKPSRAAANAKSADSNVDALSRKHAARRSEEHTSELQSLMRISYAVFCLQKKKNS